MGLSSWLLGIASHANKCAWCSVRFDVAAGLDALAAGREASNAPHTHFPICMGCYLRAYRTPSEWTRLLETYAGEAKAWVRALQTASRDIPHDLIAAANQAGVEIAALQRRMLTAMRFGNQAEAFHLSEAIKSRQAIVLEAQRLAPDLARGLAREDES